MARHACSCTVRKQAKLACQDCVEERLHRTDCNPLPLCMLTLFMRQAAA